MSKPIIKTSSIKIEVGLNENKIPEQIKWIATDSDAGGENEAGSFIYSTWDGQKKEALSIHLWTTKMTVEEMNFFVFQHLMTLAESYSRATGNKDELDKIQEFAKDFARRNSVIK